MNNPRVVTLGQGNRSELVHLLRGISTGLWDQMHPTYYGDGADFMTRRVRGETSLTIEGVIRWIDAMTE